MIGEIIIRDGKDEFKDNTFSSSEWSAPTLASPEEIRNRINSLHLVGRKIKKLRMIGLSYFFSRNWIENFAYNALPEDMSEEERQFKSNYNNINPDLESYRYLIIDEPFLIKFEDGDIFEIDTPRWRNIVSA